MVTALITALDTGLRIKLNENGPNHFMWWFSGNWSKSSNSFSKRCKELTNIELSEATKELEKATLAVENAETNKARLDASVELKKATALRSC
jgi:hypothetical protein